MSDYLDNPHKVHSDILNALKAIAILIVPAIGLFLFNIAIYSYKSAYFQAFNLPFIPLESSLWIDIIQNKTLVILLYAFAIPFLFTHHFHLFIFSIKNLYPKGRKQTQATEAVVLHDISFITLGITYLFIIFILFVLLMESVAARLSGFHAKEKVAIMVSPTFKDRPEHIRVNGTSLYLEGCDYKKCLGYQPIQHKEETTIHPKFFSVNDIQFINPEIIQTSEE